MKAFKSILLVSISLIILLSSSCTINKAIPQTGLNPNSKEYQLVERFLELMKSAHSNIAEMKAMIAPSFIEKNEVKEDYKINNYSLSGFKIFDQQNNAYKVYLWGESRSWVHELTFLVVSDTRNKKIYLMPAPLDDYYHDFDYVHPWNSTEGFIQDNLDTSILGEDFNTTPIEEQDQGMLLPELNQKYTPPPAFDTIYKNPKDYPYPNIEFEYAVSYTYNVDEKTTKSPYETIMGDNGVAQSATRISYLNKNDLKLINRMFAPIEVYIEGNLQTGPSSYCYIPRDAIIFYDKEDQVVAYLEVCFECGKVNASNNMQFPNHAQNWKLLSQLFHQQLGHPKHS